MALSVLTIPTKGYGLWDSKKGKYIFTGSQDDCYTEKHKIESAEQAEADKQWRIAAFDRQVKMLTKGGLSGGHAIRLVSRNFSMG